MTRIPKDLRRSILNRIIEIWDLGRLARQDEIESMAGGPVTLRQIVRLSEDAKRVRAERRASIAKSGATD